LEALHKTVALVTFTVLVYMFGPTLHYLQDQGLGGDAELDDVRLPEPTPKRRGRPPKSASKAKPAAAAGDDADGEDEEEEEHEEGGGFGDDGHQAEEEEELGRGQRGSGRLQAVLAAAAAVSAVWRFETVAAVDMSDLCACVCVCVGVLAAWLWL
jgi:hypothetical protein